MSEKEVEEIKAELRRIEKENQDRRDTFIGWAVAAIIIALIAFALWNNHRINGNDTVDTGDPICVQDGDC
jgi:hypothetical protein